MKSSRLWKAVLAIWLVGCAGTASSVRNEHDTQPAVVTGEEACRDRGALVLRCGEHFCAFYRCREVAFFEVAPLEPAPRKSALFGDVVLTRGVGLGVAPSIGPPARWWDPMKGLPRDAEPVFIIPWKQPPRPLLPPSLQAEAEQRARRPHARHYIFPPEEEFREWFASKGISAEAWTVPILVEDYLRIHAGARGSMWNEAWREFIQAKSQASKDEVWSHAGELCLRFEVFGPILAGPGPTFPPRVADEATVVTFLGLDPTTEARVDKALAECADLAQKEVLARRMNGRNPTPKECLEQVGHDAQGKSITRAQQLGLEMHQVAFECAQKQLSKLRPLGFSIEPRYRYDQQSGRTTPVSPEVEQALLRQGLGSELRGTIVPDVVLHTGNPARVQAVYDFKFPCMNGDVPDWRRYPAGHPFEDETQETIYKRALGGKPARVVPRLGVIR